MRIAPLYYVSLVIALLIPTVTLLKHSVMNLLSHLFFVNGLNPMWNNCINVEWYISDLMLWYLAAPCFFKTVRNLKSAIVAFIISTASSSAFIFIANQYVANVMSDSVLDAYFHTQCILIQLPVLFVGVILYYLKNWKKQLAIFTTITIIITGLFILLHLNKRVLSSTLIAGMLFGCLFLFMRIYSKNLSGIIGFIGKHSFGIYLFHLIVIKCFRKLLNAELSILLWVVFLIIIIGFSVGIGYISEICTKHIRFKMKQRS